MAIYAIGDLHLDHAAPEKGMEIFGEQWRDHKAKIARHWQRTIHSTDIVLLPGDISWSASLPQALPDLRWLDQLSGTKVAIKGNHDHWWGPIGKTRSAAPRSIHLLQNDSLQLGDTVFFGAKLSDFPEANNLHLIDWQTPDKQPPPQYLHPNLAQQRRQFQREMERLTLSIQSIPASARHLRKIALLHYPPTTAELCDTPVTQLLESLPHLTDVVFGHLHSLRRDLPTPPFGSRQTAHGTVRYHLCSADWLQFIPLAL